MSYRYPATRIHEIVSEQKVLEQGANVHPKTRGEHGVTFTAGLQLVDGPFLDMRYVGNAGDVRDLECFRAAFLLDKERVRGVDYCSVARKNFRAKKRIPQGWHQNIIDPNLATTDAAQNRHEPLPGFEPIDFRDFTRKVAELWNIDLHWEEDLL